LSSLAHKSAMPTFASGPPRRRYRSRASAAAVVAALLGVAFCCVRWSSSVTFVEGPAPQSRRDAAFMLASGSLASVAVGAVAPMMPLAVWAEEGVKQKLDRSGRAVMPDGSLALWEGKSYEGAALFNGKPKVFVAGSTGELGRRVVLDLLRGGFSIYCGYRDAGKKAEMQYENRRTEKYEQTIVPDNLIETGRAKELAEQLADASVVIDVAGAMNTFDVFRPQLFNDNTLPERVDLNGTKALIDAAKARGVKKFIYVSAILTNGRALGAEVSASNEFVNWNKYGNVLDCKHEAEEYLKASGLDYTIIRPVPMDNTMPKDLGGISFQKADSLRSKNSDPGNKISRDDVSLALLDAIFNPKASNLVAELTDVPRQPPTGRAQWWDGALASA